MAPRRAETMSELEAVTMQLQSVQRNYESMSRMMQAKQAELDKLEASSSARDAKDASLSALLKEALARADAAEAQLGSLKGLPGTIAALQQELKGQRFDLCLAEGRSAAQAERLVALNAKTEEADYVSVKVRRELDAAARREVSLREELRAAQASAAVLAQQLARAGEEAQQQAHALTHVQAEVGEGERRSALLAGKLTSRDEETAALRQELRAMRAQIDGEKSARAGEAVSLAAARGHAGVVEGQLESVKRSLALSEVARKAGQAALEAAVAGRAEACAAAAAAMEKAGALTGLLAQAEEHAETNLSRRVETDEVVNSLQFQVRQGRALLAEAQRQEAAARAQAEEEAKAAAAAVGRAEAHAQHSAKELVLHRQRSAAALSTLVARVGPALERLSVMQSAIGNGLANSGERYERIFSSLSARMEAWEETSVGAESSLHALSQSISLLRAASERRKLSASQVAEIAQDEVSEAESLRRTVETLRSQLSAAESSLASEHAAAIATKRARERESEAAANALSSARRQAQDAAEAEGARVAAKLDALVEEVARLERSASDARRSAMEQIGRERAQMEAALGAMRAAVSGAEARAEELSHVSEGSLASLSCLHQAEVDRLKRETAMRDAAMASIGGNVAASWDACQRLLRDMGAVSGHLAKMGWQVKEGSGAPSILPGGSVTADGSDGGEGLVKAILLLRLHFSYITEAVQDQAARPAPAAVAAAPAQIAAAAPPRGGERTAISVDLLKELKAVVGRLVLAEAALEGPCTCLACLQVLSSPLLCTPCGHTLCAGCLTSAGGCPECDGSPVQRAVPNLAIEAVCSKLEYRRMSLASIQGLLAQHEHPHTTAGSGPGGGGVADQQPTRPSSQHGPAAPAPAHTNGGGGVLPAIGRGAASPSRARAR